MTADCSICQKPCALEESILAHENSGHFFHKCCLIDYLAVDSYNCCPLCKKPIDKYRILVNVYQKHFDALIEIVKTNCPIRVGKALNNMFLGFAEYFTFTMYLAYEAACKSQSLESMKILLCHRFTRGYEGSDRIPEIAAGCNAVEILKYLVECLGFEINLDGDYIEFGEACANGCLDTAKYLFEHEKDMPIAILHRDLSEALSFDHLHIAEFISSLPGFDFRNMDGTTLRYCFSHGTYDRIKWLIEKGVDPSVQDSVIVSEVAQTGDMEGLRYVLSFAGINAAARDNAAIRAACSNGSLESVQLLMDCPGVDPSAVDNEAIIAASRRGCTDIVTFLLADNRVDPHARNCQALQEACNAGHMEIVQILAALPRSPSNLLQETPAN